MERIAMSQQERDKLGWLRRARGRKHHPTGGRPEDASERVTRSGQAATPSPGANRGICPAAADCSQARSHPKASAAHECKPAGETEVRLPDGAIWQFRFAKEFCNVAWPVGTPRNQ
jgi:hypothetical protein